MVAYAFGPAALIAGLAVNFSKFFVKRPARSLAFASYAVVSLIGRVFMGAYDCPFRWMDDALPGIRKRAPTVIVDFHAEATSEKIAFARMLDGKVSAVVGTHTHVQTADERILPKGTAYLTDVGMTGPHDSVIGARTELSLRRFVLQQPLFIGASHKSGIASIADVIKRAKEKPGEVTYAATGVGRLTHLTMELFQARTSLFVRESLSSY